MQVMDVITEYKLTGRKKKYKQPKEPITKPDVLSEFARSLYKQDINVYESVYLIALDRGNQVNGYMKLSQGTRSAALVDIGLMGKFIIGTLCAGVALVHNHPSGKLEFSKEDINMTQSIANLAEVLTVQLIDSIIVTDTGFLSMAQENNLHTMKSKAKELVKSINGATNAVI